MTAPAETQNIIFVDHEEPCYRCHGRGWIVRPWIECQICHGTGVRRWSEGRDYRVEHLGPEYWKIEP